MTSHDRSFRVYLSGSLSKQDEERDRSEGRSAWVSRVGVTYNYRIPNTRLNPSRLWNRSSVKFAVFGDGYEGRERPGPNRSGKDKQTQKKRKKGKGFGPMGFFFGFFFRQGAGVERKSRV
jgi:hypothetical protein